MAKEEKMEEQVNNTPTFTERKLSALDCLEIRRVPGPDRAYKTTNDDSRYKDLTYRTYIFDGKGFTIPTLDAFNTWFDNGELGEVKLMPSERGFDFISAKSQKAIMNAHKFAVTQKAFTVEFVQSKLTMEELNEAW
jgi:hypothetical protein